MLMSHGMQFFLLASKMEAQIAFSLLKTTLGGWITNRRIQRDHRCCIFCQGDGDSLQHRMSCDRLWHQISISLPFFLPHFEPSALIGLAPPPLPLPDIWCTYSLSMRS